MKNGQMHISTYMKLLNKTSVFWIGIIVMLVFIILSIFAGNSSVSSQEIINSIIHPKDSLDSVNTIIYNIRLPRIVAASICGAALSLSGLIAQEALSNNLASPSVMGINNGAGLFVLFSGILFPGMIFVRPLMAFVGSMVSACIVYVITRYAGSAKSTFILSGVAVSALMSAGVNLIITIEPDSVYDKVAFQLGSLSGIRWNTLIVPIFVIIFSLIAASYMSKGIELFSLGDETAYSLGVNVRGYRVMALLLSVLLAASAVSVCGLVSFVGLIVPNIIRLIDECSFRVRLGLSTVWGINLLLISDYIARNVAYPYELPVGMLISLLGAPFFILMIIRKRRKSGDVR